MFCRCLRIDRFTECATQYRRQNVVPSCIGEVVLPHFHKGLLVNPGLKFLCSDASFTLQACSVERWWRRPSLHAWLATCRRSHCACRVSGTARVPVLQPRTDWKLDDLAVCIIGFLHSRSFPDITNKKILFKHSAIFREVCLTLIYSLASQIDRVKFTVLSGWHNWRVMSAGRCC